MPIIGSKFSTKKTPPRRSASLNNLNRLESSIREEEYGLNYTSPKIKLGGQEIAFDAENGLWVSESGGGGGANQKEFVKLKKQNQALLEENNLLKLKNEILLDMLAETTAEKHLQERDYADYSKSSSKSGKKR